MRDGCGLGRRRAPVRRLRGTDKGRPRSLLRFLTPGSLAPPQVSSTPSVAFVKSVASVRRVPSQSARATSLTCSAQAMKVLMMGGTRFIGARHVADTSR